jgi:hemerythrin-like domain-containing protein
MAKHLTMNTVIHAAVRRDLRRFTAALDSFPVGSKERASQLSRAWQHLDGQLYHHHHSEETIFWPALREVGADESLVTDLGGEHDRMAEAMKKTSAAVAELVAEPGQPQVEQSREAFADLAQAVETHFAHEETDLEAFSASVGDTAPMKKAQEQVRKSQSPVQLGGYLAWLQDEADPDARAYLNTAIPRPALVIVSRLLGRRYRREIASVWGS